MRLANEMARYSVSQWTSARRQCAASSPRPSDGYSMGPNGIVTRTTRSRRIGADCIRELNPVRPAASTVQFTRHERTVARYDPPTAGQGDGAMPDNADENQGIVLFGADGTKY